MLTVNERIEYELLGLCTKFSQQPLNLHISIQPQPLSAVLFQLKLLIPYDTIRYTMMTI